MYCLRAPPCAGRWCSASFDAQAKRSMRLGLRVVCVQVAFMMVLWPGIRWPWWLVPALALRAVTLGIGEPHSR